jgi:hypothetical protein
MIRQGFFKRHISTAAILMACSLAAQELPQVDGTTGAPLGGIGTGAIKFCGNNGHLYFTDVAPCRCGNNLSTFLDFPGQGSFFELYSNRAGTIVTKTRMIATSNNGRFDDDGIYPIQKANFGAINGINVTLVGSCPWAPLDSNKMNYPCAMFQFQVQNTQTTSADVSIGFKVTYDHQPALVAGKGMRDETANSDEKAVYAKSDDASAVITMGSDGTFLTNGQCSNQISGSTNMAAVKVTLSANQTKLIKFVFAWYNATQPDSGYYHYVNLFPAVGAVADSGLSNFDLFVTNATSFVNRMRGSNVPDWVVGSTLNGLCPLTNNSRFYKDGRMMYAEGLFGTEGTQDQTWHARYIVSQLCPSYAWQELQFWARTQKIAANDSGQVHHDLASDCWGPTASWDMHTFADYKNIDDWPDLNCGFIFNVYETFRATGDKAKLDWFWPYVRKAGIRLLNQVKQYGNTTTYPYTYAGGTSESSYDYDGSSNPGFNSGLTIPAYKLMARLCSIENDPADSIKFQNAHDTAVINFKKAFIDNIFPAVNFCEAVGAGAWISDLLKIGHADFASADIDKMVNQMNSFYNPLTYGCGKPPSGSPLYQGNYDVWTPYLLTHYGDLALIAGQKNIWYAMRHDQFQRIYNDRNRVFNMFITAYYPNTSVPVATDPSGYWMYITFLDFFREYHSILGYQRDKSTGELWLEPNTVPGMNNKITNGFYIAPEGDGTINYTLDSVTKAQSLLIKPDSALEVNQIYVKDLYGTTLPPVYVNGAAISSANVTRIGMGYGKELKINWSGKVNPSTGLLVEVTNNPTVAFVSNIPAVSAFAATIKAGKQLSIAYSIGKPCRVSVALYHLDGRKIADISDGFQNAGNHAVAWAGNAGSVSSPCIVSIVAGEKKMAEKVMILGR